eukprot:222230-Pyramimonas_sp.AAC.1
MPAQVCCLDDVVPAGEGRIFPALTTDAPRRWTRTIIVWPSKGRPRTSIIQGAPSLRSQIAPVLEFHDGYCWPHRRSPPK